MKWREMLNADCPKRDASQLRDRAAAALLVVVTEGRPISFNRSVVAR
jgi:hypothetical protein